MKLKLPILIIFVFVALSQAQNSQIEHIDRIYEALTGSFDNYNQERNLPDSISRVPAKKGKWLNPLCLEHLPVDIPALGDHVIFIEWRERNCDGELNRQSIWALNRQENGSVSMDFYSLKPEDLISIRDVQKRRLRDYTPEDLVSYPSGCTLQWTSVGDKYIAYLNPKTCAVTEQMSGREMSIEAVVEVDANGFLYSERGVFTTGDPVFTLPGMGRYRFIKAIE